MVNEGKAYEGLDEKVTFSLKHPSSSIDTIHFKTDAESAQKYVTISLLTRLEMVQYIRFYWSYCPLVNMITENTIPLPTKVRTFI